MMMWSTRTCGPSVIMKRTSACVSLSASMTIGSMTALS
jgi:hypothetical protein